MTFLIILYVLLLSTLMLLLPTLNVSKHLICWFWSWIWPMKHQRLGAGSGLLISMLGKLFLFCLISPITLVIDVKIDGSAFEGNLSLKLVSAIFYQIFISHQMIALQKLWKLFFISSKKLFLFSRYLSFL